jgi:K+-sensing histidine kinase KdpD
MQSRRLTLSPILLTRCLLAVALVLGITVPMLMIGRQTLGEGVIVMLYLAAIGLSSQQWGRLPGACAALSAALTFDFFFVPPFLTFAVGRLEGWLVLTLFLFVSLSVVGRYQDALNRARANERDAVLLYELAVALAGLQTQEAVLRHLARSLQQMFQAGMVKIVVATGAGIVPASVKAPSDAEATGRPDRIIPLLAAPGLIGEIHFWRGSGWLPEEESRLLGSCASLACTALERARSSEIQAQASARSAMPGQ